MEDKIINNEDKQVSVEKTYTPDYINNDNPENMKKIIKQLQEKKKEEEALNNGK